MLQIACWGDELYLKKFSHKSIDGIDMRCFRDTLQYWSQSKSFKADAFLIFSDIEPQRLDQRGFRMAFNLRAMFDVREPIVITSFRNLTRDSVARNLIGFFASSGNYFLRLPVGVSEVKDTVQRSQHCRDTLELRVTLIASGYFDKLKHDLKHLPPKDKKTKIIIATLRRFSVLDL